MGDWVKSDEPDGSPTMAEGDDAARSETFRLFSHDIRSAVSDVVGGLRLIDTDRLDPETRMQVERVRAAGETLAGLVDSALMAAAGETPVMAPENRAVLADLIELWRRRWAGRASESGARFELVCGGRLPLGILAPPVAVERIVGNLVGNALLHGGRGHVRLTVSAGQGGGLSLEVADDGPGFPPPKAAGKRQDGHGLGLRIARELSRQIGGELELGNEGPLGGAVARLSLPEARLDWCGEGTSPPPPDLSELRILVAEDNLTNQAILRQFLTGMRADPIFVSDGAEALDALDRQSFDIALIDIEMPRISGLEVMQAVRARGDRAAAMPLVALTAYVLRDNREAIYAAGADGIIGKPISSAEEFGRAILRHAGRPAGLPEPEDVLSGGGEDVSLGVKMDEARLNDLLAVAGAGGGRELLDRLEEDLRSVRRILENGVLVRSVPHIREQTHILIALSGAVGADRLCRLAEVLNIAAKRGRMDDLEALHAPCRRDLDDLIALIRERRAALE